MYPRLSTPSPRMFYENRIYLVPLLAYLELTSRVHLDRQEYIQIIFSLDASADQTVSKAVA